MGGLDAEQADITTNAGQAPDNTWRGNMKTIQSYRDALKIIASDGIDYKALCILIAEENPSLFVGVFRKFQKNEYMLSTEGEDIHEKAFVISGANGKVEAVKYLRNELEIGLKEAAELLKKIISEKEF